MRMFESGLLFWLVRRRDLGLGTLFPAAPSCNFLLPALKTSHCLRVVGGRSVDGCFFRVPSASLPRLQKWAPPEAPTYPRIARLARISSSVSSARVDFIVLPSSAANARGICCAGRMKELEMSGVWHEVKERGQGEAPPGSGQSLDRRLPPALSRATSGAQLTLGQGSCERLGKTSLYRPCDWPKKTLARKSAPTEGCQRQRWLPGATLIKPYRPRL